MDDIPIDKKDLMQEGSDNSVESTPEAETGPSQENPVQLKRKGGRKPIYATSEERKQRNRQAQAAFRERRTEYIKQLEDSIRVHETNLQSLQAAHRSAADECLMLRYKNSLLERILLEKGIDVQAELQAKTGSSPMGANQMPQGLSQPATAQRTMLNRHHQARRLNTSIAPKQEPGTSFQSSLSPQARQAPVSQTTSPMAPSPGFGNFPLVSPTSGTHQRQQHQRMQSLHTHTRSGPQGFGTVASPTKSRRHGSMDSNSMRSGHLATPYHQSQTFQNHIEQLEQEYDEHDETIDDQTESAGPGPYPETFPLGQQIGQSQRPQQQAPTQSLQAGPNTPQGYMNQLLDPFDSMMDTDPFGLSKSLQFPGKFYYDNNSMR